MQSEQGQTVTGHPIQIRTLGTFQVIRRGKVVTEKDWHTRQARQLLKILLTARPQPVPTERLIETLWPQSPPAAAATTLRSAINALRNVLEPERPKRAPSDYILTQNPGYAFALHKDIWLDVEHFEMLLDRAAHAQAPSERKHLLQSALQLYSDDFLVGDPYAEWAQSERERLRERSYAALLEFAALLGAEGHFADAISACRRILARDEVRENAYQLMIRLQAESGDSAAALVTYERCRTILAEELGADPSPLTQAMHQRVLNGQIRPQTPSGNATASLVEPQPPNGLKRLPQATLFPSRSHKQDDYLVGRAALLEHLGTGLQAALGGEGSCYALEGEAGVGKTRLALSLLHIAADHQATVLSATCQPLEQKLPFAPLADSISRYLHTLPDDAIRNLPTASLVQIAQIVPSLYDRVQGLPDNDLYSGSPDDHRQRLIDGIVAFFVQLCEQRPLALLLDDLQWADNDTLAVLSRLSVRLPDLALFVLLTYRTDDGVEDQPFVNLLHTLSRAASVQTVSVPCLLRADVQQLVELFTPARGAMCVELADYLWESTRGNPLFVTEALRDLQERLQRDRFPDSDPPASNWMQTYEQILSLRSNRRVHDIIHERFERLPDAARRILRLAAVFNRDFSLELLEAACQTDPLVALEILLHRRFLVERPDERLDFNHEVVCKTVYDGMTTLERRRYHRQAAAALCELGRADEFPGEVAFHYSEAGKDFALLEGQFQILAGEQSLRAFGYAHAVAQFERALEILAAAGDVAPELTRRALQGRGLAYENLLNPDGVADSYRRLQQWAQQQGDLPLLLTVNGRLAFMLELVGHQEESTDLLRELMEVFSDQDGATPSAAITDLIARRQQIYSPYDDSHTSEWAPFSPPPPVVAQAAADIERVLEPVHQVFPLMAYGWALRVQGQLVDAAACLTQSAEIARRTGQPSLASIGLFQLAVIARMQGNLAQSQRLNEESLALNHARGRSTSELISMWPRIGSAFQSLRAGRLEEASRRLRRVVDYLAPGDTFHNHRLSATIGLGLIALDQGDLDEAAKLLQASLTSPVYLYPYTHVQARLGLARIDMRRQRVDACVQGLQRALRFCGRRSLLEEYIEVLLEIARLHVQEAPLVKLIDAILPYVDAAGMHELRLQLIAARTQAEAADLRELQPATPLD